MATTLFELLNGNPYPGRGIVAGMTEQGHRFFVYFLMGRSANSRNRILKVEQEKVFTAPFDAFLVTDPSLIIYQCVGSLLGNVLVTNGDQTQTILEEGSFRKALMKRTYEPDSPSYTPRISALLGKDGFEMSILRKIPSGEDCDRSFFSYGYQSGQARYLSTYVTDGDPLPSWEGDPALVSVPGSVEDIGNQMWLCLDSSNKISLVIRDLESSWQHIYNKHLGD